MIVIRCDAFDCKSEAVVEKWIYLKDIPCATPIIPDGWFELVKHSRLGITLCTAKYACSETCRDRIVGVSKRAT